MSADTTNPEEIACTEYTHDGCLVNELDRIDLSHLEFDDNDDWLYMPPQCSTESTIQDLYTWLKTQPELDVQSNKRCIDTRTFTRPKKRTSRMSFESIFEGLPRCVTNIWKPQNSDNTHTEDMKKFSSTSMEDKQSVPPMLKPSVKMAMNALSNETLVKSGQESMEAFLNMSQSKGIDSFINLGEPEFSDPLMNMSQPSILYTSIIGSESTFAEDNVTLIMRKDTIGQQIAHRHSNVQEKSCSGTDATFVMQSDNDLISPNETYRVNTLNDTFYKESAPLDIGLNETYDAAASGETLAPPSNKKGTDGVALSSTFTTEPNTDNFTQLHNQASDNVNPLDVTYLSSPKSAGRQDTTTSIKSDTHKNATHANKMNLNVTCNVPSDGTGSGMLFAAQDADDVLDMSFRMPICSQSTPIHPNALNPTSKLAVKHSEQPRPNLYSTLKAPMSLRKELLAEIRRSDERKLDVTYNHVVGDYPGSWNTKEDVHVIHDGNAKTEVGVFPLENRYHTYRKSAFTTTAMAKNQCKGQYSERDATLTVPQRDLTADRKFYTFTKKSNNNLVEKNNGGTENTIEKNVEVMRPNMDSTFCKPLPKALPKRNSPRMFSKLPQFLQKSNPNLVSSSLRTAVSLSGSTSLFSAGYIKGSQPNIMQNVEKSSLPSKLYPFGKLKSGSEQRLVEVNVKNNEFPAKGVTGSTESIESTQSAHSAPDLDDRLSTCSDSSHNSCNKGTMNIEQLHQIVRMQEESLKQDSMPKPHKRVLENTWVETKTDLPSPILKNGIEHGEIDTHSLLSVDVNMKCSSPIISPTGSSHALNNDGNPESNTGKTKDEVTVTGKTEGPNQVVPKIENKTRLRQPTNWGTGSKPSAVISGIPRPASRIPAPRFVRPNNAKANQADLRKGCT